MLYTWTGGQQIIQNSAYPLIHEIPLEAIFVLSPYSYSWVATGLFQGKLTNRFADKELKEKDIIEAISQRASRNHKMIL